MSNKEPAAYVWSRKRGQGDDIAHVILFTGEMTDYQKGAGWTAKPLYEDAPRWIPVAERLPDEDALCAVRLLVSGTYAYSACATFTKGGLWEMAIMHNPKCITHWLELPALPEVKS